jgi:glycosyltransferase involved in cell wall biosynthesis
MRVLYASLDVSTDVNCWSGLPYFMRRALERQGLQIIPFHDFSFKVPFAVRTRNLVVRLVERRIHLLQLEPALLRPFAELVRRAFAQHGCAAVFAPITGVPVAAFIDPSIPVVSYGDSTKHGWISTYNQRDEISRRTWKVVDLVDREILARHRAVAFSSEWAMQGAVKRCPEASGKVHVIPFGANIAEPPSAEVLACRHERLPREPLKLLFLGKEWERKGGPDVLRLARALEGRNIPVKLRIAGCRPPDAVLEHPAVEFLGYLDKSRAADLGRLHRILLDTHFLVMFPRAEAYGLVFCEANAFGVPVLATAIGGIPTIVANGVNGRTFPLPIDLGDVCDFIVSLFADEAKYKALCTSSRRRYEERLNWGVAGAALRRLIEDAASRARGPSS